MGTDVHSFFTQSNGPLIFKEAVLTSAPIANGSIYIQASGDTGIGNLQYNAAGAGITTDSGLHEFGRKWASVTGNKVVIAPYVVSGSSLLEAAAGGNGFWDYRQPAGLYHAALASFNKLKTQIAVSGGLTGVRHFFHWNQGEQDAKLLGITAGVTEANYLAALNAMLAQMVTDANPTKICLWQSGTKLSDPSNAGYAAIRSAQAAAVAANAKAVMAYSKFGSNTTMLIGGVTRNIYTDDVHWSDYAANEAASAAVDNILAAL